MQHFLADSEYLGKINSKKKNQFFFQSLALPKDPQSFSPYRTVNDRIPKPLA